MFFRYPCYTNKHISHLLHLFFLVWTCVMCIIYFWMSPLLNFSLQFALLLTFRTIKVTLLSNDAAFIPPSNTYHTSWVYIKVSVVRLRRTSTTSITFFFNVTNTGNFKLLYLYILQLEGLEMFQNTNGNFLYHIHHKILFLFF